MKNSDMPAMPVIDEEGVLDCHRYKHIAMSPTMATGQTKYEKVLAHFMSAMLSNPAMQYDPEGLVSDAKRYTDAYFEFLETKNPA
ncbi:hypothetical protein SNE85_000791 [Vibrio cholerae]|nr:hypothetical protein [Vibrio cholerae]